MPTTISTSYPSGTTIVVTITFKDEDDNDVTPNSARWSLYRGGSIVNSRSSVDITSLSNSVDVVLQGDDLVAGTLYFVISGTYDSDAGTDLPFRDWAEIDIDNIVGV